MIEKVDDEQRGRVTGYVKRLVQDRGFGFIKAQDGVEYFFHANGVSGDRFHQLLVDDEVEFEVEVSTAKGPRAHQVRRLSGKAGAPLASSDSRGITVTEESDR